MSQDFQITEDEMNLVVCRILELGDELGYRQDHFCLILGYMYTWMAGELCLKVNSVVNIGKPKANA